MPISDIEISCGGKQFNESDGFFQLSAFPEIEGQARHDRLHRLRKDLVVQDIGAALLFDFINLCSDCDVVNMKLNASRNPG